MKKYVELTCNVS